MHTRCPQCQHTIEVDPGSTFHDIPCPSCGSSFSLVSDESTATLALSRERTIGHFSLINQLGVGTFGSVWKARDSELDRFVALKIPRREAILPEELDLFLREARAAAQLKHPNVVSIHEIGRDGDTVYIVSDLVDGVTLGDWLTANRMPPREAAKLCRKIAAALHHAHERGVVHRDLKPSNIMLDLQGEPHIMDFGLAKREAGEVTMTIEGRLLGTPAYMSPEQALGNAHSADRRSDIYSLGVILFELITGERPFRGNSRMLLHQVIHDEPPGPRRLNHSVPRDLETICLRCLRKEPRARYDTAADLAEDLTRFLNGQAILARPSGKVERLWRLMLRNPIVSGLTTMVVVLLFAALGLLIWFLQERALRAERDTAAIQDHVRRQELASRKVLESLDEAAQLRGQAQAQPSDSVRWELAAAAAQRAKYLLDPELADADLSRRVTDLLQSINEDAAKARDESAKQKRLETLVTQLDAARLAMASANEQGLFDRRTAVDAYARAFREYGIDVENLSLDESVEKIQNLPPDIRRLIAGALDDWLYAGWAGVWEDAQQQWSERSSDLWQTVGVSARFVQKLTFNVPVWHKLLIVANRTDPDPVRVQLREAAGRFDLGRFHMLTNQPDMATMPPETLMLAAGVLRHTGNLKRSAELLRSALAQRPNDFWLHHNVGDVYSVDGQWEDAARHYCAALSLRPENTLLLCKYAQSLTKRKRFDDAILILNVALRLTPDSAFAYSELGTAYAETGQPEAAIEAYRKASQLAPNYIWPHRSMGLLRAALSDWKGAAESLTRAVELRPQDSFFREQLGLVLIRAGEKPAGLEHCREAVRLHQSGVRAISLARRMAEAGGVPEAWTLIQDAVQLNPPRAPLIDTCLLIGRQLRTAGQNDLAYQAFHLVLSSSEWHDSACHELARELVRRDMALKAVPELKDLPVKNRMVSLLFVAELLCLEGQHEQYRSFCQTIWETYHLSQDPIEQYFQARIYAIAPESGVEPAEIIRIAEAVSSQAPTAWHLHALAMAHFRAGQFAEARAAIGRSRNADPAWSPALNSLAMALAQHGLGRSDDAWHWLEQSRQDKTVLLEQDALELQVRRREAAELVPVEPVVAAP